MEYLKTFQRYNEEKIIYQFTTSVEIEATKKKVSYKELIHHFTTYDSLVNILSTNTLLCGDDYKEAKGAVSLTRNANIPNTLRGLKLTCRISLDKCKLEKDYKLTPYLFIPDKKDFSWECKDEVEEQIKKDIKSITSYITEITIIGEDKENLKNTYPKILIKTATSFSDNKGTKK